MLANIHIKASLVTLVLFVGCLSIAQDINETQAPTTKKPAPAPTTTLPPTTPPPPLDKCELVTEKPSSEVQKYFVDPCVVAEFAAYIKIGDKYLNLGKGSAQKGIKCADSTTPTPTQSQSLVVDYECGQLTLNIVKEKPKDDSGDQIYISDFKVDAKVGKDVKTYSNNTKSFLTVGDKHYYKCDADQTIEISDDKDKDKAELHLGKFAYEAFRTEKDQDFHGTADVCSLDSGVFSDGVRIGVAICLIGFVVIILIAYFVGRRRWSQRSSYESV